MIPPKPLQDWPYSILKAELSIISSCLTSAFFSFKLFCDFFYLSPDKQKASLGRKRKPEVFTALGDDVVTRLNIVIT